MTPRVSGKADIHGGGAHRRLWRNSQTARRRLAFPGADIGPRKFVRCADPTRACQHECSTVAFSQHALSRRDAWREF